MRDVLSYGVTGLICTAGGTWMAVFGRSDSVRDAGWPIAAIGIGNILAALAIIVILLSERGVFSWLRRKLSRR